MSLMTPFLSVCGFVGGGIGEGAAEAEGNPAYV